MNTIRMKVLGIVGAACAAAAIYSGAAQAHSSHTPCGTRYSFGVQASCQVSGHHAYAKGHPDDGVYPRRVSVWCGGSNGADCNGSWDAVAKGADQNLNEYCEAWSYDGATVSDRCPDRAFIVGVWMFP